MDLKVANQQDCILQAQPPGCTFVLPRNLFFICFALSRASGKGGSGRTVASIGWGSPPTPVVGAPHPIQVAISPGSTFQMSAGRMQGTGFSLCESVSPLSPHQDLGFLLSSPSWPSQKEVIFRNTLKPHPFKTNSWAQGIEFIAWILLEEMCIKKCLEDKQRDPLFPEHWILLGLKAVIIPKFWGL